MISQLDFYVEDILNPKVLIIKDSSFYNPDIVPTSPEITIKYPGSTNYITTPVGTGFTYTINSNTIGLTRVNLADSLTVLPDGLWTIRYSICPNDELFVEYTFLRNTKQLIKYHNLFCSLEIHKCNRKEYEIQLKLLREIKQKIDAAKYLAECGKYTQSIELYDAVCMILDGLSSTCNCYK